MEKEFKYPKDPQDNLIWRYELLKRTKRDLYFREIVKELFFKDILFAFNAFFYTLDVRKRPFQHQPFCTWEYQDECIVGLQESIKLGRDEVWEKSRDMGASWMILGVFMYFWLSPQGGADFLLGSRVEDYVDRKGDMRALFPKLRYILYRLPIWLRPKGINPRKHDTYSKLENPETGSVVIGESNNANFSTGGRFLAILYDEFAKWESTDEQAWTAGGDATPCRIANSTPFGAGGQYFKLVTDGRTLKRSLSWTKHPEKAFGLSCVWPSLNEEDITRLGKSWRPNEKLTSPWYEEQEKRRSPKEMAQEIDMNYLGSGSPVFDGKAWTSLQLYSQISDNPKYWGIINLGTKSLYYTSFRPLDVEGHLIVYNKFKDGDQYTIGVDVVEGVEEGDYAFITIYNRIAHSLDAIYFSRIDEVSLATVIMLCADEYSPEIKKTHLAPWVGIETTGPGLSTFNFAVELGIANLFMAPRYDISKGEVSYKKGWRTDRVSRAILIGGIKSWLMDAVGELNSHRLVGEMMTFIHAPSGKAQAKSGCHDDGVMSFGIALQLDEICPLIKEAETKRLLRQPDDFTSKRTFVEIEEPKTIEERCFADAVAKKALVNDLKEYFPFNDQYFNSTELEID